MAITQEDWRERYELAQRVMQQRPHSKRVLIQVASQHPLDAGRHPNAEFTARLIRAKRLYEDYIAAGYAAEIYVPGSRHKDNDKVDEASLSQAGVNFLHKAGLSSDILRGDDLNSKYKGDLGVYNTADECFVSASYFKDYDFERLDCVISPVQIARATLHYIWQGVLPLFYSAPIENAFHDPIDELYGALAYTRDEDPGWQDPESRAGRLSRKLRTPDHDA